MTQTKHSTITLDEVKKLTGWNTESEITKLITEEHMFALFDEMNETILEKLPEPVKQWYNEKHRQRYVLGIKIGS